MTTIIVKALRILSGQHDGWGPNTMSVCERCSALVDVIEDHNEWHRKLDDRLSATAKGRGW